ncbi:putative ATP-dependent DNA helicase II subunit 1 [Glarea lozoyensis 74030]|uniref:DNA helicase n=1 Tax=Glarea lozoyensis (strain ATCC 74030 / MF5533) TaxID=1104152 RepID=H0EYD1_GLAL7|nr:putative ATP-dependent DNA helicase II subunit 1 [Glarea lozoyensis 74030]
MADSRESWKNEDEEEEEELDEASYIAQKDAVLFAIDVSSSMLAAPPASDARNSETDSPTVAAIKYQNSTIGKDVQKAEIKKAYKFGGAQVLFTPEEQKELKSYGSPILRIIGFKPQNMLPFWASVKKSTFIYPSEDDYVGSTRVFAALWKKLLKDKKMGIAWYVARNNATPLLVAILPSQERFEEGPGSTQVIPAGLWLYPIPFADDIRSLPELPAPVVAPDELIDEMRKIVQQLQLPKARYDPSKYPNPSLQWHYKILQAMALEEDVPESPDDKTIPKYRQINNRAGEFINNWGKILAESTKVLKTMKHELDDDDVGPPAKKVKVKAQSLEDMSVDEVKKAARDNGLTKHTVTDLKHWLASKGLSTAGKKTDLLERIEQWAENS